MKKLHFVLFEVLTVVTMESNIYRDVTASSPIELHFYRTTGRYIEECGSLKLN
jgi:hypothetical protein